MNKEISGETSSDEEFIRGMQDCQLGKPHLAGRSERYYAGYNAQYQLEEINSKQAEMNQ